MKLATAHQDFFINEPEKNRVKILRQDRIHINDVPCFVEIDGQRHVVSNFSAFGLAINSKTQWFTNSEYQECPFMVDQFEIASLHLKAVRNELTEDDGYIVGFEVLSMPVPVEQVFALFESFKIIKSLEEDLKISDLVPVPFREGVWRTKDYLESLKQKITDLETSANKSSAMDYRNYEMTICQFFSNYFTKFFVPVYDRLFQQLQGCDEIQKSASFKFFRENMRKLIYEAPFANRVYSKPLGYAGDYEMMNLIYRSEVIGESLFAKCLHYYLVNEPSAVAVKNRADYLQDKIVNIIKTNSTKDLKILSVACGPAMEIQKIINENSDLLANKNISIHLLDQDESALKFTQRTLRNLANKHSLKIDIRMVHSAIKNVITRGLDEKYDLIYSAGLFDYLTDPVAQMAGSSLFKSLKKGGELIIGNFNTGNPNKFIMAIALDWHLIYRSIEQMKGLFSHLEGTSTVEHEGTGINLFYCTKKDAA
ncbi:MAG: methyltransferase domain-containing protein [Pseudomonadota bacterium]|nr:methyltransferase domain-containing protein [Pseudomonadota bacterium]